MSGLVSVTALLSDRRDVASIGHSRDGIKGLQYIAWLHLITEGVSENDPDLARAIDVAQRPIDCKPEILVPMRQRQSVGFEREIIVGETELARIAAFGGEIGQNRLIREIGDDLSLVEHGEPVEVGLRGRNFRRDIGAGQRVAQALLGRRAGQNANLLAGERAEVAGRIAADQQARPVDEGRNREVDVLAAGEGLRSWLAEKIGLAVFDRVEPVLGGHQHISDFEIVDVELLADMLRDRFTEIDHEAGRQARVVGEREWRRVFAESYAERLVLPRLVESARVS